MCNPYLIFMDANLPRAAICLHVQYLKILCCKLGLGVFSADTLNLGKSLQGILAGTALVK